MRFSHSPPPSIHQRRQTAAKAARNNPLFLLLLLFLSPNLGLLCSSCSITPQTTDEYKKEEEERKTKKGRVNTEKSRRASSSSFLSLLCSCANMMKKTFRLNFFLSSSFLFVACLHKVLLFSPLFCRGKCDTSKKDSLFSSSLSPFFYLRQYDTNKTTVFYGGFYEQLLWKRNEAVAVFVCSVSVYASINQPVISLFWSVSLLWMCITFTYTGASASAAQGCISFPVSDSFEHAKLSIVFPHLDRQKTPCPPPPLSSPLALLLRRVQTRRTPFVDWHRPVKSKKNIIDWKWREKNSVFKDLPLARISNRFLVSSFFSCELW